MSGYLLPGPRGRWRKNWRKDRPCGLPALPSPRSTVELATSSFRWLRTGPPTECGRVESPSWYCKQTCQGKKATVYRVIHAVYLIARNVRFSDYRTSYYSHKLTTPQSEPRGSDY